MSGGDSSDRYEREISRNLPDSAQLLKSHCRVVIRFAPGREDGAERDVVDWQSHRSFHLLLRVRRQADQRIVFNQTARGFGPHVVLSNVEAASTGRHCDINAIVDNQGYAIVLGDVQCDFGLVKEVARRELLFAQLNEGRATIDEPLHLFSMTQARELSIGDGIDLRQRQSHDFESYDSTSDSVMLSKERDEEPQREQEAEDSPEYYYDDSTGYRIYKPESEDEDSEDEGEEAG